MGETPITAPVTEKLTEKMIIPANRKINPINLRFFIVK